MRAKTAILALVALAAVVVAPPAAAKAPFFADVYVDATGEYVASLEPEEDRIVLINAVYDEENVQMSLDVKPERWDYRIVMYFNAERQSPSTLFYFAPRDGTLGVVYWPESILTGVPEGLIRSASFDALMATYGLQATPYTAGITISDATSSAGPGLELAAVAAGIGIVATLAALWFWRRKRGGSVRR